MPSAAAAALALARSRDAMATTCERSLRSIAGMTFFTAMSAAPSTPQRTGWFGLGTGTGRVALESTNTGEFEKLDRLNRLRHGLGRTVASAATRMGYRL